MKSFYRSVVRNSKRAELAGLAALALWGCGPHVTTVSPVHMARVHPMAADCGILESGESRIFYVIPEHDLYQDTSKEYMDMGMDGKLDVVDLMDHLTDEERQKISDLKQKAKEHPDSSYRLSLKIRTGTILIVDDPSNAPEYSKYGVVMKNAPPYHTFSMIQRDSKEARKLQKQFEKAKKECPAKLKTVIY